MKQAAPPQPSPWRRAFILAAVCTAAGGGYVAGVTRAPDPAPFPRVAIDPSPPGFRPSAESSGSSGPAAADASRFRPPSPPEPPVVERPGIPLAAPSPDMASQVEREVVMEISRIKPVLDTRCWETLPPDKRPDQATYVVNLAFDPQGRELARGIEEPRGAPPELGTCLRGVVEAEMRISAQGVPVSAFTTVTFP